MTSSFTIEVTQQQARILNELADILGPVWNIGGHVVEHLAESAQASQDEIDGTLESVFNQTYLIMEGRQ